MSDQGNTFNFLDYYGPPPLSPTYAGALQAAISAAAGTGGIVLIPPGSYEIDANVNPVSGIIISGYGASLVLTASGQGNAIFSFAGGEDPPMSNLMIEGLTLDISASNIEGGAIALDNPYYADILLRDVRVLCSNYVTGAQSAVSIGGVNTSIVNNHSERIHVDHCVFLDGNTGSYETLRLESCDQLTVIASSFFDVNTILGPDAATEPIGLYAYTNGASLLANNIQACYGTAVAIQGQNIVVCGNTIRNGANTAGPNREIWISNCENVTSFGNSFSGQSTVTCMALTDFSNFESGDWPVQFSTSSYLMYQCNLIDGYDFGVSGSPAGGSVTADQADIVITNNVFYDVGDNISLQSSQTPAYTENNP
jgi:hypothetical protein